MREVLCGGVWSSSYTCTLTCISLSLSLFAIPKRIGLLKHPLYNHQSSLFQVNQKQSKEKNISNLKQEEDFTKCFQGLILLASKVSHKGCRFIL